MTFPQKATTLDPSFRWDDVSGAYLEIVSRVGAASAAMLLALYPKSLKSIAAEAAPTDENERMDKILNGL